jgi:tRNA G18 (ribose-2'-O)-methylase SpoU
MPTVIDDPADPRLDAYRALRDRVLRRDGGRFIIESHKVFERAIAASWPIESVVCVDTRLEEIEPLVPPDVPLYVVSNDVLTATAGFKIHTGVLAIGIRQAELTVDQLVQRATRDDGSVALVVCSQLKETANLGAVVRICAGLGVGGMIIGPHCCDPLYRRAVRVSMGAVFNLPIMRSDNLAADVRRIRDEHDVQGYATVLADDAVSLHHAPRSNRTAIVLGHEVHGLPADVTTACTHKVTIPMASQTDSLNVAMSAAIFIYELLK